MPVSARLPRFPTFRPGPTSVNQNINPASIMSLPIRKCLRIYPAQGITDLVLSSATALAGFEVSTDGRFSGVHRGKLLERRFGDIELLIIYIDGMHFREECVLAAIGVDAEGPANTCWRCARARHGGQGCAPIPRSTTLSRRGVQRRCAGTSVGAR